MNAIFTRLLVLSTLFGLVQLQLQLTNAINSNRTFSAKLISAATVKFTPYTFPLRHHPLLHLSNLQLIFLGAANFCIVTFVDPLLHNST